MRYSTVCSFFVLTIALFRAPRVAAKDRGTHFLAELDGGALLSGSGGPAVRAVLGVGGKLEHTPARFYLIGQYALSTYAADDSHAGSERGVFDDWALGPRVYLPLVASVRIFLEATFGATLASGTYTTAGLAPLQAREWLALAQLSAGLQWRVLYELSLGLRGGLALQQTGLVGVARSAGAHDLLRPSIMAGLTWHF
jgi:hypothetical protein